MEAAQEQSTQERSVLPAPPPVDNTSSRPRTSLNQPRRINPLNTTKRPTPPVNRSSTPNGAKDSSNASASVNRASTSTPQPIVPPQTWPYSNASAVPLFGSIAMDPATRNRIIIDRLGERHSSPSTGGSDGESPTGTSKDLKKPGPRRRIGTPTANRARAPMMRESPVASGDLGLPLVAAVENGRAVGASTADGAAVTDGGPNITTGGAASGNPTLPVAGQESPSSDTASARKVRFTDNAPPPVNPLAMVPTALIGTGFVIGQSTGAGSGQATGPVIGPATGPMIQPATAPAIQSATAPVIGPAAATVIGQGTGSGIGQSTGSVIGQGSEASAGVLKGYADLPPFLKQYRGELEQQWYASFLMTHT